MKAFLYDLKGQATVMNGLMILLILAFIFYRIHKIKTARSLFIVFILIFLLCSTSWLPGVLVDKLERSYPPLSLPVNDTDTQKVLIHVLGSGCNADKRLPANAQIGLVALGRLAEAIRIHRAIKNSVIICSGNSSPGLETQAQVTKRAAIVLGIAADMVGTLNTPFTTEEEARALAGQYDKSSKLIIVTDAMHMPRAMKLFRAQGFNPMAAPTNYRIKKGPEAETMKWWPSFANIDLMNSVIHEWLGSLKAAL